MKPILQAGLLLVGLVGRAQAEPPLLQQREQTFVIHLNAAVAEVTPLFGPVREAEWAPTWAPRFIHPADAQQREGAIFTAPSADGR